MKDAGSPTEFDTYFLLPFTYSPTAESRVATPASRRRALDALVSAMTRPDTASVQWRQADSNELTQHADHYNERQYLHRFARKVLDEQVFLRPLRTPWGDRPADTSQPNWPLTVTLQDGKQINGLRLVDANLHLFPIGVGILALHVSGRLASYQDLLTFNQVFRWTGRDYPERSLVRSITLDGDRFDLFPDAHESIQAGLAPQCAEALRVNRLVAMLLGDRVAGVGRVEPILDWRMVVLTWAAAEGPVNNPCDNSPWSQLLFVDDGPNGSYNVGHQEKGKEFLKDLLDRHEYRRWWKDHRIGFTRYSAAFLGRKDSWFFNNIIRKHVGTVYYTLALLTYLHRAKLLEMSSASAHVAEGLAGKESDSRLADRVRRLREDFLLFSTHYWFIELTHQDQGIDMSHQWAKVMDNERLFDELREEIERFEAFQSQRAAERTQRSVTSLTIVLALIACWTGLLGSNFFPQKQWLEVDHPELAFLILTIPFVLILLGLGTRWLLRRRRKRRQGL